MVIAWSMRLASEVFSRTPERPAKFSCVTLLRTDELLDVLESFVDVVELAREVLALFRELLRDLRQHRSEVLAARVLDQELRQLHGRVVDDGQHLLEVRGARVASLVRGHGGRHVDAVERVADVVQDARGDLGHAGGASRLGQRGLRLLELAHHAVELAGQDADLVGALELQLGREVLGLADHDGVIRESAHRVQDDAAQHHGQHEHQEHARGERGDRRIAQ